jgi:hypothetical protein
MKRPSVEVEQARAFTAVASMVAWNLEVACRMAKPIDEGLFRLLSAAWARATEVMVEQRARWQELQQQHKDAA